MALKDFYETREEYKRLWMNWRRADEALDDFIYSHPECFSGGTSMLPPYLLLEEEYQQEKYNGI